MSLEKNIMDHMKEAMKAKDTVALEALRAIKSAIILAKTEAGAGDELSAEDEIKMLQRLIKQRKDSAAIYNEQGRADLAEPELAQVAVIEKFLPAQLTEAEVEVVVAKIITDNGLVRWKATVNKSGNVTQISGVLPGQTSTVVLQFLASLKGI